MNQLASVASVAIANGAKEGDLRWADPDRDFFWIAADNTTHEMDAQTVVALNGVSAQWRTINTYLASLLFSKDPIPLDYTDDKYWTF